MAKNTNNNDHDKHGIKGPKRRNERNILTFYEKIAVIRYYDETNISRNSLAKMFHCCATQIRRILEKKDELMQQLATLSEADASIIIEEMTRKRRKFEMSAISFILHQWVERNRQLRLRKTITNQILKETALKMAAILNLPAFRPSYRWLNRFRGKYKYNEEDLGAGANGDGSTVPGDLSVEDIIIEFKDSLPNFMQKEISAITSITKVEEKHINNNVNEMFKKTQLNELNNENSDHNSVEYEISDDDDDDNDVEEVIITDVDPKNVVTESVHNSTSASNSGSASPALNTTEKNNNEALKLSETAKEFNVNVGASVLLNSVFPHLAVIHQFALMNSDIKALELISQLGVHMQTQATTGAYKQISQVSTANDVIENGCIASTEENDNYPDIDDIILIE